MHCKICPLLLSAMYHFQKKNKENLEEKENPGNFIAFLKVLREQKKYYKQIQTHLQ